MSAEGPVARVVGAFLDHLTVERGASAHTVAGYRRDLARYADFLAERGVTDLSAYGGGDAPILDIFVDERAS